MEATLQNNQDVLSKLSPVAQRQLFITGLRNPDSYSVREEYLRQEFVVNGLVRGKELATQTVHTPFSLCEEMINKLKESIGPYPKDLKILVYNVEFLDILYRMGILWNNDVWFINENPLKVQFAIDIYVGDESDHFVVQNWLNWDTNMKFDVIVGNPPYQASTSNKGGAAHTLWDKFVDKSFSILKDGGFLCYVHPSGWRRPTGTYKPLGKSMREKQIEYLELHNIQDGIKTFGVTTRYDWYVLKNTPNTKKTIIKGEDGITSEMDLTAVMCIPNGKFNEFADLLTKDDAQRINIINDCAYHCQNIELISKIKTSKFKYPCIYSLPQKGMQFRYSSTNTRGHFGIPKVIFSNGAAPQVIVDETGEYGLTQWAFAIVDEVKNLPKIKAAMESKRFIEICKYMRFTLDRYDVNFMSFLKKDFWKHFVDENGKEI